MGHSQEMFCFCIKKITESEAAREVWCRVGLTRVSGGVGSRAIARGEPGERDQAALCLGLYHTPVILVLYTPYIPNIIYIGSLHNEPGQRDHTVLCL